MKSESITELSNRSHSLLQWKLPWWLLYATITCLQDVGPRMWEVVLAPLSVQVWFYLSNTYCFVHPSFISSLVTDKDLYVCLNRQMMHTPQEVARTRTRDAWYHGPTARHSQGCYKKPFMVLGYGSCFKFKNTLWHTEGLRKIRESGVVYQIHCGGEEDGHDYKSFYNGKTGRSSKAGAMEHWCPSTT